MAVNREKLRNACMLIEKAAASGCFPGAAVSIGSREGVYYSNIFGRRCLYPESLPMHRDTLFDMASLTKVTATNMLFLRFLEKGLISVYDKVCDYMEYFKGEDKENITIFNLLTHTAGFPPFKPLYKICSDYEDAVKYICTSELDYEPGTRVVYSDFSFILLGYILEKIGGERLDTLCKRHVFEPLNMASTCFNPKGENIAATEIDSITGITLTGTCHDENGRFFDGISGHAGLFSNIDDMTRFALMLINKGRTGKTTFLSPVSISAAARDYTPHLNESRGLGWCIKGNKVSSGGDIISPTAFGHTGFTGTSMWIDIENDIFITLLTNRVHPTRNNINIIRFRRLFHNAVLSSIE